MNKLTSFTIALAGVLLINSCDNSQKTYNSHIPSKLLQFEYMGTKDTSCAILSGQILGRNEKGDTIPLEGITIVVTDNYIDYETDKDGKFTSCNSSGAKEVEIAKNGYQIAILENYVAKPGQLAGFKILLEQGEGDIILKIE
jgi:hypothetical protein